jgi:TP901 family phage tail tape measure protein
MTDVNLRILLSAVGGAGVSSAIGSIASSLGSGGLGGALLSVGVATAGLAVGIGVTAVKAAGTFQEGLTSLVTGAGEAQKNIGMVGDGILNLAVQTGTSTAQLTSGMYQIESAGYHGSAGLAVLAAAARGARVGNASLGTVADATTTIMTDFGIKSQNASIAVNTLVATVANGKTTMDQLAGSLSQILPTASAAGVSLTDTAAAMSTMTGEGVPAAQAATYLRQTILGIEAPSTAAGKALNSVGLTTTQVSNEMKKSLPGALQMITDAVGKQFPVGSAAYVNAIKNISGGSKTMQGMLDLTGVHLATFKANVGNIASAVKNGGSSINGWSAVQQNFNFKMSQGSEVVQTLMIRVGQQLLPAITQLATNILPLVVNFSNWIVKSGIITTGLHDVAGAIKTVVTTGAGIISFFQHNQLAMSALQAVLITVGIFILDVMVGAMIALAVSMVPVVVAAVTIAISFWPWLVVVGIVLLIIVVIKNWGAIAHWLQGVWAAVLAWILSAWGAIVGFFTGIWHGIQAAFGNVGQWFQDKFKQASDGIKSAFSAIGAFFSNIWKNIQQAFGNVGNWFHDRFQQASNGVKTGFGNTGNWFQQQGNSIKNTATNMAEGVIKASQWMYQHNTYFKAMCDAINQVTKSLETWLQTTWNSIKATAINVWNTIKTDATNIWNSTINFIKGLWTTLSSTAKSVWSAVSSAIMSAVNTVVSWVKTIWNNEVNGISIMWRSLVGIASSAWSSISSTVMSAVNAVIGWLTSTWNNEINGISIIWHGLTNIASSVWASVTGVFQNAWGGISSALSGLWSNISGWFSNLTGQMVQFGENLINSLAQGITNAAGAVSNAASGVASNIAKFLGFHSPAKEGPASDADVWMPNFMNMLATGVLTSLPTFRSALNMTAAAMSSTLQSPSVVASSQSGTLQSPTSITPLGAGSSGNNAGNLAPVGASTTNQTINLTLTVQAQKVDENEMDRIAQYSVRIFGDQIRDQLGNV